MGFVLFPNECRHLLHIQYLNLILIQDLNFMLEKYTVIDVNIIIEEFFKLLHRKRQINKPI